MDILDDKLARSKDAKETAETVVKKTRIWWWIAIGGMIFMISLELWLFEPWKIYEPVAPMDYLDMYLLSVIPLTVWHTYYRYRAFQTATDTIRDW